MIYKFVRKHFPGVLGMVNKKAYRKKLAKKKQDELDACLHSAACYVDDDGCRHYKVYCPHCKKYRSDYHHEDGTIACSDWY